jgi:hypothetical protein
VFGSEYSYGYCPEGTGVYRCKPRKNPMYKYRDSYSLGSVRLAKHDVAAILRGLSRCETSPIGAFGKLYFTTTLHNASINTVV